MRPTITILLFLFAIAAFPESQEERENKDFFREFVRLMNDGEEEEFYDIATRYEQFLQAHQLNDQYYKIKTNEGFFDVNHSHPFRAMQTVEQLEREMLAAGDSSFRYLVTGLKGDVYKFMHHVKADSIYRQALREVGNRDPKFAMLVHMSLAQVNYMTKPDEALDWANRALEEAETLENFEYRSMALGMKGYLYFMMGKKEEFYDVQERHNSLKERFDALYATGKTTNRQRFNHRYDAIMQVAALAFDEEYDKAFEMAEKEQLNLDRQLVIFRIYGMEGLHEKEKSRQRLVWGFIAMTVLYIFVYIMGRRRLMRVIWKRERELKEAIEKAEAAQGIKKDNSNN